VQFTRVLLRHGTSELIDHAIAGLATTLEKVSSWLRGTHQQPSGTAPAAQQYFCRMPKQMLLQPYAPITRTAFCSA